MAKAKPWKEVDERFLYNNSGKLTLSELEEALPHCNRKRIMNKCSMMGVRYKRENNTN